AATGVDVLRVRPPRGDLAAVPMPREARRHRRLVRALVLREPDVAVDAERRLRGVRVERDVPAPELLLERDAQLLEGLPEQALVLALARLEPLARVVLREVGQELDRFRPEAGERGRGGRRHGCQPPGRGESTPGRRWASERGRRLRPAPLATALARAILCAGGPPDDPARGGRLPRSAADPDRPVRAHDGRRLLE